MILQNLPTPFLLAFMLFIVPFIYTDKAYPFCFEEAGKEYNIAPDLLYAIADYESSFNSNAINYNKNGTYDYGHMQINSWWYDKLGPELWNALADPCTNVRTGAYILAMCIQRYGYNWDAVGCYHSPNKEIAARYITKIQEKIVKTKRGVVYAYR